MPLPYENELDHWRSSSHPLPSRPSDAPPTLKPSFSFRNEGWALDNAAASSSSQPKKHRRRRRPTDDALAKGQEHELLDAVSNEEILQLTNLATTLPDRSRKKEYRHDHLVSHDQIKASIRRQQSTHDNDDGVHEDDQPLMVPEEGWRSGTADTEGSAPTKSYDPSTFSTDTDDTAFRQQRQQIQTMIDAYTHQHQYQHQHQQHQPPPTKDELAAPSMSKQPSMEQPAPEKPTVTIPGPERRRTWHMNLIKKKQALSASSSTTTASYDDDWQPSLSHATIWKRPHLKRLRFSRHHRSSSQDTSSNGNKRQQASSSTSAGSGAPISMAQGTSSNISHKKHRLSAILRRRHSFDNLREFHSDDDSDLLRPVAASAANSIHDRPARFASPPPMHQVTSTATSTSTPSTDTQQQHSHHSHHPHDTPPATHLRHHVPNPDQGPDQQRDTTTPSPDHHQLRVQVQTPPSLPTTPPPIHPTEQPTPNATPIGPKRVLYFDVDALPGANDASNMAALVHRIVDAGHGAIRKMRVRFDDMDALNDAENDDDDDDDDDDVEDENGDRLPAIKASRLITPNIHALVDPSGVSVVRRVAEVYVDDVLLATNNVHLGGFDKLIPLPSVSSKPQGLLNLHVRLDSSPADLGVLKTSRELCQTMDDRLATITPFVDEANSFLIDNIPHYEAYVDMDDLPLGRAASKSFSAVDDASSVAAMRVHTRSTRAYTMVDPPPSGLTHDGDQRASYQYYHHQLSLALSRLQAGRQVCRESLINAESLLRKVKNQVRDTSRLMEDSLKDVSEDHYSKLNDLEINVESIMANRAKSRGMDLIYWILTAVLTGFAFALWALIWTIKFVRDVFLIPSKMFRSYRDHVDQRNDKVQLKSRESVTKAVDRPPSGTASSGGTPSSSSSSSGGVSAASSAFNSRQPSSTSSVVPAAASVVPPQLLRSTSTAVPRKNTARRPSSNRT